MNDRNITLHYGDSSQAAENYFKGLCSDLLKSDPIGRCIYLVPSRRKASHVTRQLTLANGGGLLGKCVYSLNDFLQEIFNQFYPHIEIMSESMKSGILGYIGANFASEWAR